MRPVTENFADKVVEALARPRDGNVLIASRKLPRTTEAAAFKLRQRIERAHRFKLSDDFTALAAVASLGSAEIMWGAMQSARPPYDSTWVEFDNPTRVNAIAKVQGMEPKHDPGADKNAGFLIERRAGSDSQFDVTVFVGVDGKTMAAALNFEEAARSEICALPFGFTYDITGQPLIREWHGPKGAFPSEGCIIRPSVKGLMPPNLSEIATNAENQEYLREMAIATTWLSRGWTAREALKPSQEDALIMLLNSIKMTVSAAAALTAAGRADIVTDSEKLNLLIAGEKSAPYEGDARFLIGILALLQQKWTVKRHFPVPTGRRLLSNGRTVPYMDSHVLTIEAPRERVLRSFQRAMKGLANAKKRRHEVMGHWCHRHGVGDESCSHHWVGDVTERQKCALCGGERWWRKNHERGDALIGFVQKSYEVVPGVM